MASGIASTFKGHLSNISSGQDIEIIPPATSPTTPGPEHRTFLHPPKKISKKSYDSPPGKRTECPLEKQAKFRDRSVFWLTAFWWWEPWLRMKSYIPPYSSRPLEQFGSHKPQVVYTGQGGAGKGKFLKKYVRVRIYVWICYVKFQGNNHQSKLNIGNSPARTQLKQSKQK